MNIISGALILVASMYQLNQQNLNVHLFPGNCFQYTKLSSLNI